MTTKRDGMACGAIVVGCLAAACLVLGCNTAAPAPAAPNNGGGLEALQGEWLYVRGDAQQPLSVDCITITDDVVTEFVDGCEGDDLLLDSDPIAKHGNTYALELRVEVIVVEPDGTTVETALLSVEIVEQGDTFVGTETFTPEDNPTEPTDFQVALIRPDANDG
ncbi:MAG: hypothetical protein GY842_01345 [bacterium]|nr:hypothetical protein [bacterium]